MNENDPKSVLKELYATAEREKDPEKLKKIVDDIEEVQEKIANLDCSLLKEKYKK